jgi:F-type H+-transporting ATPase subunit b
MTPQPRALLGVVPPLLLAAAPAHAAGGLELMPDPMRLVALLVLFLLLVPILNALLFKPLLGVLEERGQRIEGARTRAAKLSAQAAELVSRHEAAVRSVRASANGERMQAIDEARRGHQAALAQARGQAELQIGATRAEVGAALDAARTKLRAEAEPLARDVAQRLLGRSLS